MRNFLIKNNIAPAGMKRAKRMSKKGVSSGYKWLPTRSIPYIFITIDGITNANINNSKYLFISDDGSVDDDGVDAVVVVFLTELWILNPKINDDVPIKNETTARIFPVRPGIIASGAPWLVCCCRCCCCCALTALLLSMLRKNKDNSIILDVSKNNINTIK